tara:strand:+ start:50 stop:913 length:864 start_codon:yes stop_codon:yes gene_type:complete
LTSFKDLDNLVPDIYEKLDALSQGEALDISDDMIADFGERMKAAIVHWSQPHKQSKGLRMSNIGKPSRQLWYESRRDLDAPSHMQPHTHIKFLYGHLLEEVLLLLVKLAGHEVTDEQKEVVVDGIKGHMDCKINGEVVDVKTASNYAFRKFSEGTLAVDDPFGYMAQLAGYEAAEGTSDGGFLAINKESGELALLRPGSLSKPNISTRIVELKEILTLDKPPSRCYTDIPEGKSGNMRIATGCNYCPFKNDCWSDSNNGDGLRVFKYSNGLKYFTKVVSEPRVEELK